MIISVTLIENIITNATLYYICNTLTPFGTSEVE